MPFKLKLKKSRHYSVVSKSLFVIAVELLDGTAIECTLSSESTGQDCLDVVCQKLGLSQPKFFGLQYMSRGRDSLTWLELDRPIKRQLDKHARHLSVYLRVMYYVVSGVRLFNDEVTRNHYFLQLKLDVIEGKISCTPQQTVELASYCMQAEFGNYDAERHTADYLKDFQLFPKCFTDPDYLEKLTDAAIRQHAALHNIPKGTAEEYYICACQRLDGYGQETYVAKDRGDDDVLVAVSLTGVTITYPSGRNGKGYGWVDIRNVINNKRDFTIESVVDGDKGEVFHFPDVESAKNAWMFCVLQHTFYRQHEHVVDQPDNKPMPNFQQQPSINVDTVKRQHHQRDSYEDINYEAHHQQSMGSLAQRAQSTSCLDLNAHAGSATDVDKLRSLLPSYRPAPDYETAVQQKYRNSAGALHTTPASPVIITGSQPEIREYASHLRYPDVTHNNIEASKNLMANVYAPYGQSTDGYQPDMAEQMRMLHICKPPPPYPNNRISSNSTPDLAGIGMSPMSKPPNAFINSIVSGSSPDLVSTGNFVNQQQHYRYPPSTMYNNVHRSQSYLPPQHGTYENLASIFNNNMLGRPHQALIVENPNITKHIKKVYDEHGNIIYCMPSNMKQILEDNQLSTQGFVVTRNALVSNTADLGSSQEPIYENIPPAWQQPESTTTTTIANGVMRARTQSIQSAPEVTPSSATSKENLYANISRTSVNVSSVEQPQPPPQHTITPTNITVTANNTTTITLPSSSDNSAAAMSRTNTFIINKNSSSLNSSASSHHFTDSNETFTTDASSTSSGGGTGPKKKKRWAILMGRSKSSEKEKVKSATLGREKDKEKKEKSAKENKHRWSTGLPRLALPPSISKETMCQLLENKLSDNQLFFEFDKIPKKKQNADFTTALLPETQAFNRFQDVLPYEDNRIKLTPTRENKYGYINASHITATVGSKQRFYIAAQGPTRVTLPHFWQCVWEAEVYLVVQLTEANEDLTYLPDSRGRSIDVGQDYQILWEFSQKTGHCVTSKVRVCHVLTRRYRTLWHLHYTDWGDQGCPRSVAHFLGFLEELQSVQLHSMEEIPPGHNKNPPVLVHCTAGVGRTGLTVLCDLLLYTVDHNQEVDIPRVVGLLRHQRPHMVQTIAQYRFVYSLLIHYIKQNRLI